MSPFVWVYELTNRLIADEMFKSKVRYEQACSKIRDGWAWFAVRFNSEGRMNKDLADGSATELRDRALLIWNNLEYI
jgi:hypothetical protein